MDDISETTFRRSFEFKQDSFDEGKREVTLSFSSETEDVVRREYSGDFIEVLSHKKGAVNLKRIRSAGSFLYHHDPKLIIGPIKRVQINEKEGRGEAVVGFDNTPEGNLRMEQVKSGSLKGSSLDYTRDKVIQLMGNEEYQVGSKTVRGSKDDSKMTAIVEKWTPIEISLTPKPFDIDVGVGRSLEDKKLINFNKEGKKVGNENENKNTLDATQVRSMVTEGITEALKVVIPNIVTDVKNALTEDAKPKLRVSPEEFRDLTNRASAISPEAMNEVTNRLLDGKTEPEILRYLTDELTKTADGDNAGGTGGDDGTKRADDKKKTGDQNVRSFKDVTDDQLWNTLKNPAGHIYN